MLNKNILGFDTAANTGYTVRLKDGRVIIGTINLKDLPEGAMWAKFRTELMTLIREYEIEAIGFESYDHMAPMKTKAGGYTTPTKAIIRFGGFRSQLHLVCHLNRIPLLGFAPTSVKMGWTGKGRAQKDDMMTESFRRGLTPKNHDEADSNAVVNLMLAKEEKPKRQVFGLTLTEVKGSLI